MHRMCVAVAFITDPGGSLLPRVLSAKSFWYMQQCLGLVVVYGMDTSLLLRMGDKIPMKGVIETKFGAEMEGRTIQRLPHPGIHPIIYNHQTQALLHMPAKFC